MCITPQPYAPQDPQVQRPTRCRRRQAKVKATHLKLLLRPILVPKKVKQAEDTTKLGDINKEVVQDAALPQVASKDPLKEKEASQIMELMLATLSIPPKEDPKDKA